MIVTLQVTIIIVLLLFEKVRYTIGSECQHAAML